MTQQRFGSHPTYDRCVQLAHRKAKPLPLEQRGIALISYILNVKNLICRRKEICVHCWCERIDRFRTRYVSLIWTVWGLRVLSTLCCKMNTFAENLNYNLMMGVSWVNGMKSAFALHIYHIYIVCAPGVVWWSPLHLSKYFYWFRKFFNFIIWNNIHWMWNFTTSWITTNTHTQPHKQCECIQFHIKMQEPRCVMFDVEKKKKIIRREKRIRTSNEKSFRELILIAIFIRP